MEHPQDTGHAGVTCLVPTAWPMVLALGVALIVSRYGYECGSQPSWPGIGALLVSAGFVQVLPAEAHEIVEATEVPIEIASLRKSLERLPVSPLHRKIIPVETFQFTTGLKGGIAGGIAMIVPATLFSVLKFHSLWYAMNLMAAGGFVELGQRKATHSSPSFICRALLAALGIHTVASLLVGLLYGAMLPMFPRWPILTAGFIAPLLWTGLLAHSSTSSVPSSMQRIDWYWFVPSQFAFGLVCGFVVNLHAKVRTPQFRALPFAVRAGLHVGTQEDSGEEPPRLDGKQ